VLVTSGALDFESAASYRYTLRATDSGVPNRATETTIDVLVTDVNDNSPTVDQARHTQSLPEDVAIGTVVANISASDADSGENGRVSFQVFDDAGVSSIVQLNTSVPGFAVAILTHALNYEAIQSYNFTVRVTDHGSPALSTTAAIELAVQDVNDNNPVLADVTYEVFISEDVSVGTQIFLAQATDQDRDGLAPVTYHLINEPPSSDFRINPTTGAVTTLTTFDFETSSSQFSLRIVAQDEDGRRSGVETLTVRLVNANDLNPVFDIGSYRAVVDETNQTNVTLVTVRAAERVAGRVLRTDLVYNLTNTTAAEQQIFRLSMGIDYHRPARLRSATRVRATHRCYKHGV